jgi:hypothetical protein
MEKVFDEVVYPEESTLKKMDHVAVTVSTQNSSPNVSTRLRRAYPSDVVQEFDPPLKFVTFTVHRDPEDEDVNNNIHPPPPQRVLFKIRAINSL